MNTIDFVNDQPELAAAELDRLRAENERLQKRVAELEADCNHWKETAETLADMLGAPAQDVMNMEQPPAQNVCKCNGMGWRYEMRQYGAEIVPCSHCGGKVEVE